MPLYEYRCCETEWEAVHKVDVRFEEYCPLCGNQAELLMSTLSKPVCHEYYSKQLGTMITGPEQRKRIAKSKGLEAL